jgi:hypothetical protein
MDEFEGNLFNTSDLLNGIELFTSQAYLQWLPKNTEDKF